ncbi:hypothetical protein [Aquimarina pacifica]|uniref:hypothetical protein n=1 Tax=Aquimarina pacifica TaxID=1296415 RepID=UPI00046EAC6F|nr:hypothetical protein [Aquimarina pacifica]
MKAIFYKYLLPVLFVFFSLTLIQGQEKVSKSIEKTYPLTNAGELHLENKYGTIIINGWEKKTAQITMDIKVTKKKKEDAIELLGRINSIINNTEDFITISSVIEEKNPSIISKFFSKANPFDFDKSNVQIDYTIYIPQNAALQITNKFGDVIVSGWSGKLKADVQHGNMWINKDLYSANIDMKFGKLKTKSITYGNIRCKNGEIDIEKSKDLKISSSGTTIEIGNTESLEIHSSKDKITIENIDNITGEVMFSTLNINNISNNIHLRMEIADFWVSKIKNKNPSIAIIQESSEININISGLTINFNASLEQGLLRIPKSFTDVTTQVIDKRKRLRNITAQYGNNTTKGNLNITGKKGVIILTE